MLTQTERACLVIADISGYTGYLAGSELDHAQDVLADLLEVVVGGLAPVLRLAKLEGDAVFTYAPEPEVDGSMLLDILENCYFAFRRRIQSIRRATTCPCNACVLIPNLNLKFCVHDGTFVRQRIAGSEELAGRDVILVHRLLKNSVTETLGLHGYGLLTRASVEAMKLDPSALGMREHRENYEHLGEVLGYIHNLERRWTQVQAVHRVFLTREDADMTVDFFFPAAPPLVWEFLTAPDRYQQWAPDIRRREENTAGRRGIGTMTHCVHGQGAHMEEILDWRPFDYFTYLIKDPEMGVIKVTAEFAPSDGGTQLRYSSRMENPEVRAMLDNPEQRPMVEQQGKEHAHFLQEIFAHLREVLAQQMAARRDDLAATEEARRELQAAAARYWEARRAAGQVVPADASTS